MTTSVPKGAGRAAHAAKTAKHAQRTPLPPKGARTGVTKKVSAEPIADEVQKVKESRAARKTATDAAYDDLAAAPNTSGSKLAGSGAKGSRGRKAVAPSTATAAEPRKAPPAPPARPATRTPSPLAGKGAAAERGAVSGALKKAGTAKKAPTATAKPKKAATDPVTPAPAKKPGAAKGDTAVDPSGSKSDQFAAFALGIGWAVEREDGADGSERVICERDPERVTVTFRDNKLDLSEMPLHEYGSRVVKLRNVSAARKVLETAPEVAAASQPSAAPRRERREREKHEESGTAVVSRRLPWGEDEEPSDEQVLSAVVGKRVVWFNKIASTYDDATVMPKEKQKHLRVMTAPNGKKVLEWCSVEGGFRSVYVENLVQIR